VDSTIERGCLYVLPKYHQKDLLNHGPHPDLPYLWIPPESMPSQKPVPAEVKKGGVLIMTNRTPHASFENSTDVVRWGMDLRYQSSFLPTNAQIPRLEGEVLSSPSSVSQEDERFIPTACFPPEPDFLVHSIERNSSVTTDPQEFIRLRANHVKVPVTKRWSDKPWQDHKLFEKVHTYNYTKHFEENTTQS